MLVSIRSVLVGVFVLVSTACVETELCIARSSGHPSCAGEVCMPAEQRLLATNDFDPAAKLVCDGCQWMWPGSYRLVSTLPNFPPAAPSAAPHYEQILLELEPSWDQSFSAASLNAALEAGSISFAAERAADGAVLTSTTYDVRRGDVLAARLENGRVRLELSARLRYAQSMLSSAAACDAGREDCSCSFAAQGDGLSDPPRTLDVDLPYEVLPRPEPLPRLTIEPAGANVCQGQCVDLRAIVKPGVPPYWFQWDHELPASAGPHRVCPSATTTYSLVMQDSRAVPVPDPSAVSGQQYAATAASTVVVRNDCEGPAQVAPQLAECRSQLSVRGAGQPLVMAADAVGNVFVLGGVPEQVTFAGGEVVSRARVTPAGRVDHVLGAFVAKFDPSCRLVWTRTFAVNQFGFGIDPQAAVDRAGNLIFTAHGSISALFAAPPPDERRSGYFLAKLSADGEVLVAQPLAFDVRDLAIDDQGHFVLGVWMDGVQLGPAPEHADRSGPGVVKLDSRGEPIFSRKLSGASSVWVGAAASGDVYASGLARGQFQLEGHTPLVLANAEAHQYIVRLSGQGVPISQQALPVVESLTPIDFDTLGPFAAFSESPQPSYDAFARVDRAGNSVLVTRAQFSGDPWWNTFERRVSADGVLAWTRPSATSYRACGLLPLRRHQIAMLEDGAYLAAWLTCAESGAASPYVLVKRAADGGLPWQRAVLTDQPAAALESLAVTATRQPILGSSRAVHDENGNLGFDWFLHKLAPVP